MQPRTQKVREWIAANYEDWDLAGWVVWRIAAETNVALSTVYKAIKQLKAIGAIEGKTFTRRQYVPPEEIAPFAAWDGTILLTTKKTAELCKQLICTEQAIYQGLRWGRLGGMFEDLNGGSYGIMIRVKEVNHVTTH